MSCDDELLLVNVTLWPTATVTEDGLTAPFAPIVIVAPTAPTDPVDRTTTELPPPDGLLGELPPHAAIVTKVPTTAACVTRNRLPRVTVYPPASQTRQKNFRAMLKPMYQLS